MMWSTLHLYPIGFVSFPMTSIDCAVQGAAAPAGPAAGVVLDLTRSAAHEGEARAWADDAAFLAWAEGGGGASVIAAELKVCSSAPFCGILKGNVKVVNYSFREHRCIFSAFSLAKSCNWSCFVGAGPVYGLIHNGRLMVMSEGHPWAPGRWALLISLNGSLTSQFFVVLSWMMIGWSAAMSKYVSAVIYAGGPVCVLWLCSDQER